MHDGENRVSRYEINLKRESARKRGEGEREVSVLGFVTESLCSMCVCVYIHSVCVSAKRSPGLQFPGYCPPSGSLSVSVYICVSLRVRGRVAKLAFSRPNMTNLAFF